MSAEGLRRKVKDGKMTVKEAREWLKQQEKKGELVTTQIQEWLGRRK